MTPPGRALAFLRDVPGRLVRRTSGAYRREIDGLRFFAIFIVLLGHLCQRSERFAAGNLTSSGGFTRALFYLLERPGQGVELFFMISGFVIFAPLAGKPRAAINGPFVMNYFRRRLLRIEPPYMILLICTYLFIVSTGYVPPETHNFLQEPKSITLSLLASLVYSHGWLFGTAPRLLPPGWSLEIEIQFYMLAPLIFFLYLSIAQRRLRALAGLTLLALSLVVSGLVGVSTSAPHWEYTLLSFFPLFWTGILICDFEAALTRAVLAAPRAVGELIGPAGLALLMAVLPDAPTAPGAKMLATALLVAACALMFLGALRRDSAFYRFCAAKWVSLLGGACYSLYLVHLQVMQVAESLLGALLKGLTSSPVAYLAVSAVTVLPFTICCGLIFYALIERTFMLKDWPSRLALLVRGGFATWNSNPRAP